VTAADASAPVALITGARRGIGRTIALKLAREGMDLALNDIEPGREELEQVAEEVRALGHRACVVPGDITQSEDVEKVVKQVVEEMGHLDVLVNNAGITRDGLVIRMTDEQWQSVITINLTGAFFCSRAVAKVMLRQRSGCIVNIASVVGVMGNAGQANYSASKAGLIGLTKTMAREFSSRGIRVNAVAPGYVDTPMTQALPEAAKQKLSEQIPLNRLGTPQDIADCVAWLVSDKASYVTGHVVRVNGGMYM
jgi:3-oxoacyl-[acyl-carrier protein] reductase